MPSIVINEVNQTASNPILSNSDIVYVPGFVTTDSSKIDSATAVAAGIPTLCSSIDEFETAFGTAPATFESAQNYPSNFSSNAAPTSGQMFAAGDADPSYVYARELINAGIPVVYERINGDDDTVALTTLYSALAGTMWDKLKDKVEYQIKYITSGGYPVFEYGADSATPGNVIATKMIDLAANRGDCIALIDHTNNPERSLVATTNSSVYYAISNTDSSYKITSNGKYAAMFTPWASYNCPSSSVIMDMPGSYAYLMSLAESLQNSNPNWLAIAGVNRGYVPNLSSPKTATPLTVTLADSYQPDTGVCINAIANVKPYGYVIWGNRTLDTIGVEGATAEAFISIRNTVSDIKKIVYTTCLRYMFEQNSEILKMNFSAAIAPTLDNMKSGNGIADYKIIYNPTTDKTKLSATIKVTPMYAVEDFSISIVMTNEDVSVS